MRRRCIVARHGAPLPYLRKVAFLESHGTEYIDLGVAFGDTDSFESNLSIVEGSRNDTTAIGARVSTNVARVHLQNNLIYNVRGGFGIGATIPVDYDFHYFKNEKGLVTIDNKKISVSSTIDNPDIRLFGMHGTVSYFIKARIKDFVLRHGGELIISLIPVLDLSGRPCLYNQAPSAVPTTDPSRYFYNAGTGEFGWGEL